MIQVKVDEVVYELPPYLEMLEDAPGYLLTKAAAGDTEAAPKVMVNLIERLPESEIKTILMTANARVYNNIIEQWTQGTDLGKA